MSENFSKVQINGTNYYICSSNIFDEIQSLIMRGVEEDDSRYLKLIQLDEELKVINEKIELQEELIKNASCQTKKDILEAELDRLSQKYDLIRDKLSNYAWN